MNPLAQLDVWFVAESQDLYGATVLQQVDEHARRVAEALDAADAILWVPETRFVVVGPPVLGVQAAAQVAVELVDVDVRYAAGLVDGPSDLERHLVHDAEDVLAGGLGDLNFTGFEAAERVAR
jgi:L-arabinose isomerase